MKRVYVRWETTEEHRAEVEVPDDWSPDSGEDDLMERLVDVEDIGNTFFGVIDRVVVETTNAN